MDTSHCVECDRARRPTWPLQNPPAPTTELDRHIPPCGMRSRPTAHAATPKSPSANIGAGRTHPTLWNAITPDGPRGHSEIPQCQHRSWTDASHFVKCDRARRPTRPLRNPPAPRIKAVGKAELLTSSLEWGKIFYQNAKNPVSH